MNAREVIAKWVAREFNYPYPVASATIDRLEDELNAPIGLTEIDGVSWCVEHDAPWYEGDTRCNDRPDSFDDCREALLYHGAALDATA